MAETIKVAVKEPGKKARLVEMENTYENLRKPIGDILDVINMPGEEDIDLWFDDSFLIKRLPVNVVTLERGEFLCGTLVVTGYDAETGKTVGLTERQVKRALGYLERNEAYGLDYQTALAYSEALSRKSPEREMEHE